MNVFDLAFSLPNDQWEPEQPPEGLMFLAQHKGEFAHYRPSMTVSGAELLPEATLTDAINSMTRRLLELDPKAQIIGQRIKEDVTIPSVLQAVAFTLALADQHIELIQYQTLLLFTSIDRSRRMVLAFTLTAEAATIHEYGSDYEAFITSAEATVTPTSSTEK